MTNRSNAGVARIENQAPASEEAEGKVLHKLTKWTRIEIDRLQRISSQPVGAMTHDWTIADYKLKIAKPQSEIEAFRRSRSCRVTAPFRFVGRAAGHLGVRAQLELPSIGFAVTRS